MKEYLLVFLTSMVPLIEIRGAIPVAFAATKADPSISFVACVIIAIVGNMIPVPIIYFFARKVLEWGKDKRFIGKFFTFCLEKGKKGGEKLTAKAGRGIFVALMLFVGIPLPGTGAWTGTLAASILETDFKKSCLAIIIGVLMAGTIVGLICTGVLGFLSFLL